MNVEQDRSTLHEIDNSLVKMIIDTAERQYQRKREIEQWRNLVKKHTKIKNGVKEISL